MLSFQESTAIWFLHLKLLWIVRGVLSTWASSSSLLEFLTFDLQCQLISQLPKVYNASCFS